MEDAVVFGDLQVEGEVGGKAVFPVDFEAEVVDIEFFGFGFVEDAENGCGVAEVHGTTRISILGRLEIQTGL